MTETNNEYSFTGLSRHEAATLAALVAQIPNGQAHTHGIGELFPKLDRQLREQDAIKAPDLGAAMAAAQAPAGAVLPGQKRDNWGADHGAKKGKPKGIVAPKAGGKR